MNRFLLFFLLATLTMVAQPSKQKKLEEQKAQIQKEIASYKSLLSKEKRKEQSAIDQLRTQKARIQLSEKLIATTEKQKRLLEDEIYLTQIEINKLNKELKILKEDYAKIIVKSYKSRNDLSRIMFVLSSQSFLQAYKRIQYMKQYANFRKMQGEEIAQKQELLNKAKAKLLANKSEKEAVIRENEKEKKVLVAQKKEQEKLIKELQKNKKKYLAEITKKQKAAKAIDSQIKKLIAEAIAAANKKNAAKTGSKAKTSSSKFVLTAEGKIVSDNFKANKGKLPWPVVKGYVYSRFGVHAHPVYKNLKIENSGVEIATEPGSQARTIFNGEVIRIQLIKGTNRKIVYVQHGDFVSIYQNLETVTVREGQSVDIKQNIGKINTDSSGKTILKIIVIQNTTTLNPAHWIYNM